VTLKLATSLDGRIATATGESRWISGPASRALVHRWRADADAVAVGIGTALAHTARELPVIVLAAEDAPVARVVALEAVGVSVLRLPGAPEERIVPALRALGERGIQSLLVEGGAGLAGALLQAGAVDRVAWFLAPFLIGGREAPAAIGGAGVDRLADAPRLIGPRHETVGEDLLVTGRLRALPVGA
jgi:diaminohydroxyphosphoribosylaminopyrimidine deaminase/5-amino-6-(5-phosphoribosylamino)uracil reductase